MKMSCPNLEHYSTTMETDCSVSYHQDDSSTNAFSDSGSDFCGSGKTESSTSEEYSEEDIKRLNRKRTRSRYKFQNKKQHKQKSLRNAGASYTSLSKSKKEVNGRCIRPPCEAKCRLRCNEQISESTRLEIFQKYWGCTDLQRQREFIASHMKEITPKYRYTCTDGLRKPNNAFFFELNSKPIRVCKTFFKATLDINDRVIRTVIKKKNKYGFVELDLRGKHDNHTTVSPEIKNSIREFIQNIPRIESHYLRAKTSREFIESSKSIADLYRDYKESREAENLEFGSKIMFYRIFNTEFNIAFFKPKKDQCDLCETFLYADENEKRDLMQAYNTHLEEKELCRTEKDVDKKKSNVAVYDLQAVLTLPKGFTSSFYYKSKINCYNFTVSDLSAKYVECFFWTEVEGKRGSNEIGTCVLLYIQNLVQKAKNAQDLEITFYSDNCCGQQKNKYILSMYAYAVHKYNLKSITHKYLIKGHSQNEGDSVHSVIEKQVKRHLSSNPIYTPDQYTSLIATAKKTGPPYKVRELSHEAFYDLKFLQEEWGHNFSTNKDNQKVIWRDIKVLQVNKENSNSFFYKTSYKEIDFQEVCVRNNSKPWSCINLCAIYSERLSLPQIKQKDIKELVNKNHIPKNFYESYYKYLFIT